MNTTPNELRYILYARKSSESEDRQMASVEDQIAEMKRYAKERGLNVVTVFEESKSAMKVGRKQFSAMIKTIKDEKADAILCWKLNRLARNPVDGGTIIDLLQRNIVKHVQTFGRDYRPTDNVIMMYVEFGMSNQFSNDLSVDVKRGTRMKAERGWNPSRALPIGYIHNKDRDGKILHIEITIDPVRYPILKKLWKFMLTGRYSIAAIKKKGDSLGLLNEKKKPFALSTYHKTFSSKFYCGYFYWKDHKGEVIEYKGKHKLMVSELQYDKVQRILGNNSNPTRDRKYDYVFKGLLRCGECSAMITAERKLNLRCKSCKHKFSCINKDACPKCKTKISEMDNPYITNIVYYRCTKKKESCSQKSITETDLKEQYMKIAKEFSIPKEFYNIIVDELKTHNESIFTKENTIISNLKRQLSELEDRLSSLAIMRADGEISKEEFSSIKITTSNLIAQKKEKISELSYKVVNWEKVYKDYLRFGLHASEIIKNGKNEDIRGLLSILGSNQRLLDKKLYFIREKHLLKLKQGFEIYNSKKGSFEPDNRLINKAIMEVFDL